MPNIFEIKISKLKKSIDLALLFKSRTKELIKLRKKLTKVNILYQNSILSNNSSNFNLTSSRKISKKYQDLILSKLNFLKGKTLDEYLVNLDPFHFFQNFDDPLILGVYKIYKKNSEIFLKGKIESPLLFDDFFQRKLKIDDYLNAISGKTLIASLNGTRYFISKSSNPINMSKDGYQRISTFLSDCGMDNSKFIHPLLK